MVFQEQTDRVIEGQKAKYIFEVREGGDDQ